MRKLRSRPGTTPGIDDKAGFFEFVLQFIKFGIVGAANTLIFLAVYYGLLYIGVFYIIANVCAFFISVINAYFWNSRYVFGKKNKAESNGSFSNSKSTDKLSNSNKARKEIKPLLKTFVVYGTTFLLSTGFLYIMVEKLGISEWLAPLINLCFTVPVNFLLIKFWALRRIDNG